MKVKRTKLDVRPVLVYRDDKLCWRVREVYLEKTSPPWYQFRQGSTYDTTYGESPYFEILEENTNG